MIMILADIASATTKDCGGFLYYLEIMQRIIVTMIGTAGIFLFFFKGISGFKYLKTLAGKVDTVASKTTMFMDKIMPRILQGLEDNKTIPKSTLAEWAELISTRNYTICSPKRLNDVGMHVLESCGIKKIIDDNKALFITDLDNAKLTTALDVEEKSFYVLDAHKEEIIFNPLKIFIFNNPATDIYTCLFIGSLYLRDLYLIKHPEVL